MTTDIDPTVRQELADLVIRYATGIDDRDWKLFRSCFADDCVSDYGEVGHWDTGDALTEFMEQAHAPCGHTMHRMGNQVVRRNGDGYSSRTYVDAIVLRGDNRKGLQTFGYYDDEFVRTGEGWKISRRRFTETITVRLIAYPES
jgi:3-phenylpropionate/cinnamic acid dioxygenase small subunit